MSVSEINTQSYSIYNHYYNKSVQTIVKTTKNENGEVVKTEIIPVVTYNHNAQFSTKQYGNIDFMV